MTKDEALKLALEALERCVATCFDPYAHEQAMSGSEHFVNQTITAIKEALAQPEQEPVAWRYRWSVEDGHWVWNYATYIERQKDDRCEPLYTTPPQRTWTPLTDEEKNKMAFIAGSDKHWLISLVENKLKEQNETA